MTQQETKNILGLQLPTDPRWVDLASISLEDILTDHAYCEQKAATSCISLIQRYPEKEKLVNELSPIVTEEWGHFRQVLAEMQKRPKRLLGKGATFTAFVRDENCRTDSIMQQIMGKRCQVESFIVFDCHVPKGNQ